MAKAGGDNLVALLGGGAMAIITDAVWNALHLPGYNVPIGTVAARTGQAVPISVGDGIQIAAVSALNVASYATGSISRIQPLLTGALLTQLLMKYILPTFGLPRYIFFTLDEQGRIVPGLGVLPDLFRF